MGLLVGVGGTWLVLRRRISRDGVEITKDHAETNIMKLLQAQAAKDRLAREEAETQRNEAMIEIVKLRGQVEVLSAQVALMGAELHTAREEVHYCRTALQEMQKLMIAGGLKIGNSGSTH